MKILPVWGETDMKKRISSTVYKERIAEDPTNYYAEVCPKQMVTVSGQCIYEHVRIY
jgi:hypothetical protein